MPSVFAWVNGICVCALIGIAVAFSIYFFIRYVKTQRQKKYLPYVALIGIVFAVAFSGILVSFISVLFINENPPQVKLASILLSYSTVSIGFLITMGLSWDIFFSAKFKRIALAVLAIFAAVWFPLVYVNLDQNIYCPDVAPGEMLDNSFAYFSFDWFLIIILSLTVFFGMCWRFYLLRKKLSGITRTKTMYLLFGFLLLCTCVPLDLMVVTEWIFIARAMLVVSFYCWYKGFSPIKENQ